ncbi:MAG: hypothetical protein Q9165_006602 [Trypethelium subeluteriae]
MGEEQRQPHAAAFPAPPPYYKHFTAKNVARLKDLQQSSSASVELALDEKPEVALPADLQCLIPPEPPSDGKCRSFGADLDISQPLVSPKERGMVQLYPSPPPGQAIEPEWTLDRASYLKKFAKSILLNFLELVGVLAVDPTQFGPKIDHLMNLLCNSHALINEYRPHQARETLIMMMEEQLARKEAEVEGINRMSEKIEEVLAKLGTEEGDSAMAIEHKNDEEMLQGESKDRHRRLWQLMDEDVS